MTDKFINAELERLTNFTKTLSRKVRICVPHIRMTLKGSAPPPRPFTTRESVALLELGAIEDKLREVTAAAADIRTTLNARHKAKARRGA